jgi:hypothetical protein
MVPKSEYLYFSNNSKDLNNSLDLEELGDGLSEED